MAFLVKTAGKNHAYINAVLNKVQDIRSERWAIIKRLRRKLDELYRDCMTHHGFIQVELPVKAVYCHRLAIKLTAWKTQTLHLEGL